MTNQGSYPEIKTPDEYRHGLLAERILSQTITEDLLICILHELMVMTNEHIDARQLAERRSLGAICDEHRDLRNSLIVRLQEYSSAQGEDDDLPQQP